MSNASNLDDVPWNDHYVQQAGPCAKKVPVKQLLGSQSHMGFPEKISFSHTVPELVSSTSKSLAMTSIVSRCVYLDGWCTPGRSTVDGRLFSQEFMSRMNAWWFSSRMTRWHTKDSTTALRSLPKFIFTRASWPQSKDYCWSLLITIQLSLASIVIWCYVLFFGRKKKSPDAIKDLTKSKWRSAQSSSTSSWCDLKLYLLQCFLQSYLTGLQMLRPSPIKLAPRPPSTPTALSLISWTTLRSAMRRMPLWPT